jgi:hypothetical protein
LWSLDLELKTTIVNLDQFETFKLFPVYLQVRIFLAGSKANSAVHKLMLAKSDSYGFIKADQAFVDIKQLS